MPTGVTDEHEPTDAGGAGGSTDGSASRAKRPHRRSRSWLAIAGTVAVIILIFFAVTAFTGLDAPGMMQRYKLGELQSLANRINADAGPYRTPDDCWRMLKGASGPLRSIAGVDYLRSRVVVRTYAPLAGYTEPATHNVIVNRIDKIITSDSNYSWGMVELEPSPDGWSPLVSCSLVTQGY